MSQLILMIAKIDDLDNPDTLTEVWRHTLPVVDLKDVTPKHYLDGLESTVTEVGWEAMRNLMVEQWRLTDELLVTRFRQEQAGATRGWQEWVCLLPQSLPFGPGGRVVGWMAHDAEVMSETQSRRWVYRHGQIIRTAEQAEVKALEERANLAGLKAQMCPAQEPRRPAAWAAGWDQAGETAAAQPDPQPP